MKKYKKRIVVFSVILVFFLSSFFLYRYYQIVMDFLYPVQISFKKLFEEVDFLIAGLESKEKLLEENKKLKKNQEVLKYKLKRLQYLKYENQKLKSLLNYSKKLGLKHIQLAVVIGYPSNSWEKYLIIDAGKKNGINVGDLVIADGYLIGKVTKVGDFSSYVTLVNDMNFRISARTRKTREFVLLQGKGDKGAQLKYVKKYQDIRVGDIVETEDIKGIPIGKIVKVENKPEYFFKYVVVKPFVKEYSVEYVIVVKPERQSK